MSPAPPVRGRLCVFAGSSLGSDPRFARAASELADELVARGYGLVYGGARVGLMGAVADGVLRGGGSVTGVIPEFLVGKEIAHEGLTELTVVSSMHERKDAMARLADAFIALPGGFGTIEEFFEVLTWGQLGLHAKPCGLLNVAGYFDHLIRFLDAAVAQQLLTPANRSMALIDDDPRGLLDRLERYAPPAATKWIRADVT
jgi:uncharacterized protein (TIGR00730 family)